MTPRIGFDTKIIRADALWELWGVWCTAELIGCFRACYDAFPTVERHERQLTAVADNHSGETGARAAAIEVHCGRMVEGHRVTTFRESELAVRFFAEGRAGLPMYAAAQEFVNRVIQSCKSGDEAAPGRVVDTHRTESALVDRGERSDGISLALRENSKLRR